MSLIWYFTMCLTSQQKRGNLRSIFTVSHLLCEKIKVLWILNLSLRFLRNSFISYFSPLLTYHLCPFLLFFAIQLKALFFLLRKHIIWYLVLDTIRTLYCDRYRMVNQTLHGVISTYIRLTIIPHVHRTSPIFLEVPLHTSIKTS